MRFWQFDDLIALGGTAITLIVPAWCEARIIIGSTTLRAEPDVNRAALRYPLRDERFIV